MIAPCQRGVARGEVTREIGLDVGEGRALKTLQLHCALPSIGKSCGNFLKMMSARREKSGAEMAGGSVDDMSLGARFESVHAAAPKGSSKR